MRIKLFENFNLEKLKSGIDDVLVELIDNGFNVRKMASNDGLIINIIKPSFEFSEIEEYVLMLIDYVNTYLPKYKDVRFIGSDSDFDRIIDTNSIDNVKNRLYWNQVENTNEYLLRSFKVCFGDTRINKVIAESYIDDMIVSDDELKRMWNNIEDIFVELKDDRYNVSITSYNSTTGLDITLISPRVITSTGFKLSKAPLTYEKIVDYTNTFEDFMKDYYKNDVITFLYTYYDDTRINSTYVLSEELLKKYYITKIVISVKKNNEKIIQRQKDKYKYLTESNWNSDVEKIESDLSDMFVELFDEGYDVLIGHMSDTITLTIRRDDRQKFNSGNVREYFLMAEEYFRDLNKDIKIIYDGTGTIRVPKNRLIKSIQMIVWNGYVL
jgi:hypothetical protein